MRSELGKVWDEGRNPDRYGPPKNGQERTETFTTYKTDLKRRVERTRWIFFPKSRKTRVGFVDKEFRSGRRRGPGRVEGNTQGL